MDARKSDFCVSDCKTSFTDHHAPDTIHGFRESVLVCKMFNCYCTISNISSISISRYQAMQVIAIIRPAYENKLLESVFKRLAQHILMQIV